MKAPASIETTRLVLRRPSTRDAEAIFARYAGDPDVTRFVGWPRHQSVADTRAFLDFSDAEWEQWPAGPYLIESRADGTLLGGTGLGFETHYRAVTGYVLAKDSWNHGYATEALQAMIELAGQLGVARLYALCHTRHRASWHVLEKCGFTREGTLQQHSKFPNLAERGPSDVFCYARVIGAVSGTGPRSSRDL